MSREIRTTSGVPIRVAADGRYVWVGEALFDRDNATALCRELAEKLGFLLVQKVYDLPNSETNMFRVDKPAPEKPAVQSELPKRCSTCAKCQDQPCSILAAGQLANKHIDATIFFCALWLVKEAE